MEMADVTLDFGRLEELERRGYTVLDAVTPDGRASGSTHSRPTAFLCIDAHVYWTKGNVQQGLIAELISGRLAARLGAGPIARIVRVPVELTSPGGQPDQVGVLVGSLDVEDTVNARDLTVLGASLPSKGIDAPSRARVVAFQTWLGIGDAQVLVRLTDGFVFSIDHGDAFGSLSASTDPSPIVTDIPGVTSDVGRRRGDIMPAVAAIEAVTDRDLIETVAQIPSGAAWRSELTRRKDIVAYLAHRRDRLKEVMATWAQS
jgi:hypothetical protein